MVRVATVNCHTRFTPDNSFVYSLVKYATEHKLDIICLQEMGYNSRKEFDNDLLKPYALIYSHKSGGIGNFTVGFLIRITFLSYLRNRRGKILAEGHLLQASFQFPHMSLNVITAYFPTGLNDLDVEDPRFTFAESLADKILAVHNTGTKLIVGGDFNECLLPCERSKGSLGRYECRILTQMCGNAGLTDISIEMRNFDFTYTHHGRAMRNPLRGVRPFKSSLSHCQILNKLFPRRTRRFFHILISFLGFLDNIKSKHIECL